MTAIERAISDVGGSGVLAEILAVSPQAITNWKSRGVPAERCPTIERATNGAVRCEDLRPDVDWAYLRGTVAVDVAETAKTEVPKEAA